MIYSHSSISSFKQCPYKFKLRYIDKIRPEVKQSIEAFMGSIVHEVLEDLYHLVKIGKIPKFNELQTKLIEKWKKLWNDNILIVKKEKTKENYFESALMFIKNYYDSYYPFNQGEIVGIEEKVNINIEGKELVGYIDRLEKRKGVYYIIDYKTNNWLKSQDDLDHDNQLATYQIYVMEKYNTDKVILNWHFLKFNELLQSKRTNEQIINLKKELVNSINKIENAKEFKTCKSRLCDWCEYKFMCPEFKITLNSFI
jgi:putative RecB family exonuclease